jgi:hypothetical protein
VRGREPRALPVEVIAHAEAGEDYALLAGVRNREVAVAALGLPAVEQPLQLESL